MAVAYKVLGVAAPSGTTNVDLYTVGAGKSAVISTLAISNVTASQTTAQVYVRVAGATAAVGNALVYNTVILPNSTTAFTIGITLAATDVITVQTATANALTFFAFGSELS
jgi:hypothetical protein